MSGAIDLSSGDFEVSGTSADVTKPTFTSVEVDKQEGTVGDTVKVSVDAEDSESGIKSVTLGTTCLLRRRMELCTFNV